ncbi:AI-2E family transporter [Mergibacter septicus]|uniref:AI-2E family transporter n=1 Tax=Mergibacter septicus TaxID=221402 RepID=A0A8E3MHD0_9PAST|nr:AI-2E family transporter [Mergibacter septicus]AWX15994.1 AI-2E family transporter [Mergibacter septicus]QDJ15247.1 AI-2E family transporter [Mergibacter septicus]UTU47335.1 AI-2E family transporter [Mergibacter septicus]WMR95486.1 AI-2E family transporter [Mergibacter septicus]
MFEMLKEWYQRRLSDPQTIGLMTILFFSFLSLYFFSDLITPLLIAVVLAYLLELPIHFLHQKLHFPRALSIFAVLGFFILLIIFTALFIIPSLWNQSINLLQDLPRMSNKLHQWVMALPENYPEYIDYNMIDSLFEVLKTKILIFGESALKYSLTSIISIVTLGIYAFLVPLMVFFLVKDKDYLVNTAVKFLPRNRRLADKVWVEMKQQIANYIRGKFTEIMVVGAISYITFLLFKLNYPLLLAVLIGFSVLVPYVGAVLVTIPLALVALFQFGVSPTFWYLMIAYTITQLLDGNLLVPLLFSEAVNLHPLAIIVAVLFFGGLWGFWGVFFAIPLATLIKAIFTALPPYDQTDNNQA